MLQGTSACAEAEARLQCWPGGCPQAVGTGACPVMRGIALLASALEARPPIAGGHVGCVQSVTWWAGFCVDLRALTLVQIACWGPKMLGRLLPGGSQLPSLSSRQPLSVGATVCPAWWPRGPLC